MSSNFSIKIEVFRNCLDTARSEAIGRAVFVFDDGDVWTVTSDATFGKESKTCRLRAAVMPDGQILYPKEPTL